MFNNALKRLRFNTSTKVLVSHLSLNILFKVGGCFMLACLVVASIIALASIFAFFGDAFSNTGGTGGPNMFNLMFGSAGNFQGQAVLWKQYGALTFLFVLQILIMVMAIIGFIVCYNIEEKCGNEMNGVTVSVLMAIMSLVALIISFCTLSITNVNQNGQYNLQLGSGPVSYSVMHIIVFVLLVTGVLLYNSKHSSGQRIRTNRSYKPSPSTHYTNTTSSSLNTPKNDPQPKPVLSESEKIDLILKYKKMLDEGIITQEEFDKKKKELL